MNNKEFMKFLGTAGARFVVAKQLRSDVNILIDANAFQAGQLPRHHRDPFDRMPVAQAQVESLVLLSNEPQLSLYDVRVQW